MTSFLSSLVMMLLAFAWALPAQADFRVEISGVGVTQIPIAIANFRGEDNAPQKITQIVSADLERSGQFRSTPAGMVIDEVSRPDFEPIRQKPADALLTGSVSRMADGRFDVRFRLWDTVKGQDMGGQSYVVVPADLRLVSHRIADQVYEKLTGDKGIFSTRIAYITKQGPQHLTWLADADGQNPKAALTSPNLIFSPSCAHC